MGFILVTNFDVIFVVPKTYLKKSFYKMSICKELHLTMSEKTAERKQ